jgi:hypothetical protein
MTNLPHLELTENPDKKSDFIIFRNSIKNKNTKKDVSKRKTFMKTRKHSRKKKTNRKKGFFKFF